MKQELSTVAIDLAKKIWLLRAFGEAGLRGTSGIYARTELLYNIPNILREPAPSACVAHALCGLSLALMLGGCRFHSTPYLGFHGPLLTGSDDPVPAGVAPR